MCYKNSFLVSFHTTLLFFTIKTIYYLPCVFVYMLFEEVLQYVQYSKLFGK